MKKPILLACLYALTMIAFTAIAVATFRPAHFDGAVKRDLSQLGFIFSGVASLTCALTTIVSMSKSRNPGAKAQMVEYRSALSLMIAAGGSAAIVAEFLGRTFGLSIISCFLVMGFLLELVGGLEWLWKRWKNKRDSKPLTD